MARSQANLQFGIAAGLRGLSRDAKLLYSLGLLCEPTMNQAGLGALRISLWAQKLEFTVAETEKALQELDEKRFALVDEDTQEFLVRTLIRNDGIVDQPNVLWAAVRAAVMAESPRLRRALAVELRLLPPQRPDKVLKSGRVFVHADPHAVADRLDPPPESPVDNPVDNTHSEGFEKGSGRVREGFEIEGFSKGTRTPGGGGGGGGGGSTCSVGGQVGGSRASAREAPTPHNPPCEKPCRRCRAARLATEQADAEHTANTAERSAVQAALVRDCNHCNSDGWRIDPANRHRGPLLPQLRCDHRPDLRAVTG